MSTNFDRFKMILKFTLSEDIVKNVRGLLFLTHPVVSKHWTQGAYNSGKPGNLRKFVNSGKLREFKIYSGNLSDACCFS